MFWNPQAQLNQQKTLHHNNQHVVCVISYNYAPWLSSNIRSVLRESKQTAHH
jgi:hypothetical protein